MSTSLALSLHLQRHPQIHHHFHQNKPIFRLRQKYTPIIRCYNRKTEERPRTEKNYYELLGVSVDSNFPEIKEAYRKLQKKYHPDIAGQKGHGHTLRLNEAYEVLMREDLRREYDASIGQTRLGIGRDASSLGYSSWKGSLRPQALFVDENACIGRVLNEEKVRGCRECVHHASNTFTMDEIIGCARVKVQYGDDDRRIEVSVDSCPVNCIHWVDREELAVLEFLIRPQMKDGHGIFGQGWDRPANVFSAAKSFNKQLKEQGEHAQSNVRQPVEEETPAQAQARANASIKLKIESFSRIWDWVKELAGQ